MNIETTIKFKSTDKMYYKEFEGIKNNTVRIVSESEDKLIQKFLIYIKFISISLAKRQYYPKTFTREIKDITRYKQNGIIIYIFTWEV